MRQVVLPIKDDQVLKQVQDTLLHNFKAGRRNLTIFQVGKATLLRVSDVLRLKQLDIFDDYGAIKQNVYIHDKKTGKRNVLYLKPVEDDLALYAQWLRQHKYYGKTEWLLRGRRSILTNGSFIMSCTKQGSCLGSIIWERIRCAKRVLTGFMSKVTIISV